MSTTGTIFNIQRFCIHDGPGIRTTVFFKGCPLSCIWCHNPESKKSRVQLSYNDRLCISCRACETVCEHHVHDFSSGKHQVHYENCSACGACTNACTALALELMGYTVSVREVMDVLVKDNDYYETSGGGITLSGGEPLFQPDFCLELLKACKAAGLHTCIETSGFASAKILEQIIPYTDRFLFDFKLGNSKLHQKYTSVPNEPILRNLELLERSGAVVALRCPIIPEINDNEAHFRRIAEYSKLACIQSVELMAYHSMGMGKATKIGADYQLDIPSASEELVLSWKKKLWELGCSKLC